MNMCWRIAKKGYRRLTLPLELDEQLAK